MVRGSNCENPDFMGRLSQPNLVGTNVSTAGAYSNIRWEISVCHLKHSGISKRRRNNRKSCRLQEGRRKIQKDGKLLTLTRKDKVLERLEKRMGPTWRPRGKKKEHRVIQQARDRIRHRTTQWMGANHGETVVKVGVGC